LAGDESAISALKAEEHHGEGPLHIAIRKGNKEMVELLVRNYVINKQMGANYIIINR
jgi:ankyrin repeat protein